MIFTFYQVLKYLYIKNSKSIILYENHYITFGYGAKDTYLVFEKFKLGQEKIEINAI